VSVFKKLFNKKVDLGWAAFADEAERSAFEEDMVSALEAAPGQYNVDFRRGSWKCRGDDLGAYPLGPIANVWKAQPKESRREKLHLLVKGVLTPKDVGFPREFSAAKDDLRIFFYQADYIFDLEQVVTYPVWPTVRVALVLDRTNEVWPVTREMLKVWGQEGQDLALFDLALKNLDRFVPIEPSIQPLTESTAVVVLSSDSSFVHGYLLRLREFIDPPAQGGAVVIVPKNNAVIFHPIHSPIAYEAVGRLISTAYKMHAESESYVSPRVFWWREDGVAVLETRYQPGPDGEAGFTPSPDWVQMIKGLDRWDLDISAGPESGG